MPCMTTTALVKGKEGTRMPGSETTREGAGSDVTSGPRTSLSALPLQRKVLLLPLLLYFAHDLELAALLNHSLSFHQPCIRSLTPTMIVRANSPPADYCGEAGGLFKPTALAAATAWVRLPCVRTTSG